jgi:hypothetical protein
MQFRALLSLAAAFLLSLTMLVAEVSAKAVEITINKVSQKMTVRVDGDIEYIWPVSTGAAGYETPTGNYRPFRMEAEHFSKEWDDAPMPHSIFFTDRGHAIHGSFHVKSLGRRASHGCVRLHPDNAAKLFTLVQTAGLGNTRVVLRGGLFDFGGSRRSFSDVGNDIDKVVTRKPYRGFFWNLNNNAKAKRAELAIKKKAAARKAASAKKDTDKTKKLAVKKPDDKAKKLASAEPKKPGAKPAKPVVKKVAEKCVEKDGKKVCTKAPVVKAASNG